MRRAYRLSISIVAVVVTAIFASSLAGCAPKPPPIELVVEPKIVKSWDVDYWVASDAVGAAISPDSKYVMIVQSGPSERIVAAVPLGADDTKEIPLYKVPNSYLETKNLDFLTSGWLSPTKAVFIATGRQYEGPHKDEWGVAVFTVDITKPVAEEVVFIPLREGYVHNQRLMPGTGRLYIDITKAIWAVDVGAKTAKVVRDGLPTYDGMFAARMAPDASAYIYQLHELDAGHGIFLLDVATGDQKVFAPNGETMGFYPAWSPDSKYVAYYTVQRKPGKTGTEWTDYQIYPGEDGPMGIAPAITVADKSGKVVGTISVQDKVLANFRWSRDSKSIAFTTGPKPATTPDTEVTWEIPVIQWDAIYVSNATGPAAPSKVTNVDPRTTERDSYVAPITFDPQNKGVFFQISSFEGESAIWYAALAKTAAQIEPGKPVKVADGYWQFYPEAPTFQGIIAAAIGSPTGSTGLWLLNSEKITQAGDWPGNYTMVIGYNDRMMVTCETNTDAENTVTVRSMVTEKVVTK